MKYYNLVNARMGTLNCVEYSNGNCYPVCAIPHGLNFFTIQTDGRSNWFYSPQSTVFEGIRLTHMPSPWLGDYGKLLIYGTRGIHRDGGYWGSYDNKDVIFEPAYINAYIRRDRYRVEVTPTDTSAIVRFTFNKEGTKNRIMLVAEDFDYSFDGNSLIIRTRQCQQYKFRDGIGVTEYIKITPSVRCELEASENALSLASSEDIIELKITTSFISEEQLWLNYQREIAEKDFDTVKREAEAIWCEALSVIRVNDPDEEKLRTFYSCLYRALLWPRKFYERDAEGNPVHLNTRTFKAERGVLYTDNGFWDTFRTLYPLLSLIDTKGYAEMAEGYLGYYRDTGWLPKWVSPVNINCMPGMLIEATLGDAIVKEIVNGELADEIFKAMLHDGECCSFVNGEGRVALNDYRKYGYVPYTSAKESVNETLDNSYGDFCIASAAEKLGYTDIANRYYGYSKNYKNLFDYESGFIRAKDELGCFRDEIFDPYAWGRDYTEGSVWQNGFGVYHDMKGLDKLYDGKLCDKIDELMSLPPIFNVGGYDKEIHEMSELAVFNYGQCAISNQPSFHIPFVYSELGYPEKTSYHIRRILDKFNSSIEGYPGDEDNGSMSAFYILSALGLYQMAPSSTKFQCSVPYFEHAEISLANGNTLTINKGDYDAGSMRGTVEYRELMCGGLLWDMVKKSSAAKQMPKSEIER